MLLSADDRALSKQVMLDYKKAFKKAPAEKQLEKDVFKFRSVKNRFGKIEIMVWVEFYILNGLKMLG